MLQQTQVSRVIPKYREFLRRFPTPRALAAAPLRDVLQTWSGLGYNRRAKHLWESARAIVARNRGRLPGDVAALLALPGIGRYTAGAIASFAFGAREPAVDTNVRRVLSRALLGVDRSGESEAWAVARAVLPANAAVWNHALMDVGALFCRATPDCAACPARKACTFKDRVATIARTANAAAVRSSKPDRSIGQRFEGSRRQQRGRIIRALVANRSLSLLRLGPQVKEGFGKSDLPWLHDLLAGLERDGLVALSRKKTRAALP